MKTLKIRDELCIVIIGRNEGLRLERCIHSIQANFEGPIIYVDSGSTDGSTDFALSAGIDVIDLNLSVPFTMARARNAGFNFLVEKYPIHKYVQFVDGDCEISCGWLDTAIRFLNENQNIATVCGKLSERFPEKNLYHKILNMEWNSGYGEIDACGGIAMYRITCLNDVGLFNESLIAGEEPELCLRIRKSDRKIWRLYSQMGTHDANMNKFSQWWTRAVRCGHAYAQAYDMSERGSNNKQLKQMTSSIIYGFILPVLLILNIFFTTLQDLSQALTILILVIYIRLVLSSIKYRRKLNDNLQNSILYGLSIISGKLAEIQGIVTYFKNKALGQASEIMEYRDDNKNT